MALDDNAEVDPATLPENLALLQEIEGLSEVSESPLKAPAVGAMEELLVEAADTAAAGLAAALEARAADHPLEEDLRTGLAAALSRSDAVVFTEAKLRLKGWTSNLGGFDVVAVGLDGCSILLETKWGHVWQGVWDVLKLASGHQHARVVAAYAVYAARPREWQRYEDRELFVAETRSVVTDYLLEQYETEWAWNIDGSPKVIPTALPAGLNIRRVHTAAFDLLGTAYELRAIRIAAGPGPQLRSDRRFLTA